MPNDAQTPYVQKRTSLAFFLSKAFSGPFWAFFYLLPVIIYKDLHATPFQVTLMVAIKPIMSFFSLYWSSPLHQRSDRLVSNLVWANILKYIPFLFIPFIDNPWYYIFALGFYMVFKRGEIPAWMELLKLNVPEQKRERIFANSSALDYVGTAIFPLLLAWVMDDYAQAWRMIFPFTALVCIASTIVLYKMPVCTKKATTVVEDESIQAEVVKPWKQAWALLKERPDFARFQVGFMLGGAGLMIMQPALPLFFVDVLNLSYTEMAFAIASCKAIGYAIASPWCAKWINKMDIYQFSAWVTIAAAFFPIFLMPAHDHLFWLYTAYFSYGMMQAGSELSWHMSGPIFAKDEDSSIYSSVNVLTVGLRGCVAPFAGSLLCQLTNSYVVMFVGCLLCLMAAERMLKYSRMEKLVNNPI